MQTLVENGKSERLHTAYSNLNRILKDVRLIQKNGLVGALKQKLGIRTRPSPRNDYPRDDRSDRPFGIDFKHRTGMSIMSLMENVDVLLQETNCLVWIMLDKLDLLYVEDIEKLRAAITEGVALAELALSKGAVGEYQLQAAIAAVHDEAPTAADTDWAQIASLYQMLEQLG